MHFQFVSKAVILALAATLPVGTIANEDTRPFPGCDIFFGDTSRVNIYGECKDDAGNITMEMQWMDLRFCLGVKGNIGQAEIIPWDQPNLEEQDLLTNRCKSCSDKPFEVPFKTLECVCDRDDWSQPPTFSYIDLVQFLRIEDGHMKCFNHQSGPIEELDGRILP